MGIGAAGGETGRVRLRWERAAKAVSWTAPTSTEIGVVAKSALAAGLAWLLSIALLDVRDPVLASLASIVVVQVSVRASVRSALQRSVAVVGGVLVALAIGDAIALNALTVALIVGLSLGVAQLALRLPPPAARQVPISALVVLSAVAAGNEDYGWLRGVETCLGAAVGVAVSLALPASRVVDARQTLDRLASALGELLEAMGAALHEEFSTDQTEDFRRRARTVRDRLVSQATEAIGNSREAAHWNVRDLRHREELGRYEDLLPRLNRTAISVWVLARGLDDHARLTGTSHASMAAMGDLFAALGTAVRALLTAVLEQRDGDEVRGALAEVHDRRERCVQAASRRARLVLEGGEGADALQVEGEWLGYVGALVQIDRIAADLRAHPLT